MLAEILRLEVQEETGEEMTDAEVADKYKAFAVELAEIVAKVDDMKGICQMLSDETQDNADPACELEKAVGTLGVALAAIVTYAHEYESENRK